MPRALCESESRVRKPVNTLAVSRPDGIVLHMMEPRNEQGDDHVRRYRVPRGKCPRCGGRDVRHLVIGLPAGPASEESTPEWVDWVGCVHPGHDRECEQCGLAWDSRQPAAAIEQ